MSVRQAEYRGRHVRRLWMLGLLVVVMLLEYGCDPALRQLKAFKEHTAAADYQWLAAQEVQCQPQAAGCNQLYLIKGDACFRLAKQKLDEAKNYTCAADHLETGIGSTTQWQQDSLNLDRAQTYENLCEALRNLQDLQQGDVAAATGERLRTAAEKFAQIEPEHLGAIYYVAKARLRALQPALLKANDATRPLLCQNVAQLLEPVDAVMARAALQPPALWSRYEANYRLLKGELTTVQRAILTCQ
jgi:hypothetical protein